MFRTSHKVRRLENPNLAILMKIPGNSPRFSRFVAMRRKWFAIVFAAALVLGAAATRGKFDSLVEAAGFALAAALVAATAISLASAPVIWMFAGKQKKTNEAHAAVRPAERNKP